LELPAEINRLVSIRTIVEFDTTQKETAMGTTTGQPSYLVPKGWVEVGAWAVTVDRRGAYAFKLRGFMSGTRSAAPVTMDRHGVVSVDDIWTYDVPETVKETVRKMVRQRFNKKLPTEPAMSRVGKRRANRVRAFY
jgi:hypothetical protein